MSLKVIYKAIVAIGYVALFCFVFFVINPLCYNIFQQPAFVLTSDFFWSKVCAPGGLSEYISLFVEQFTMFRFWGTLFLVAEVFLTALLVNRYVRKMIVDNACLSALSHVLASAMMFIVWTDIKYAFAINMQALLLAAALNLYQLLDRYSWQKYATPLIAAIIYIVCGPVPLYIFTLCCVILFFAKQSKRLLVNMVSAIAVSALLPFVVYKFILPIGSESAFYQIVPQEFMYTSFPFNYTQLLIFVYIVIVIIAGVALVKISPVKHPAFVSVAVVVLIVGCSYLLQQKRDDIKERTGCKMQVAAYFNDWDKVLEYANHNKIVRNRKLYDRYINYYYDMALAVKQQLPEKMLVNPHLLGINALFVNEPIATVVCLPAAIFYMQAGFVTNALHYAFEAQTTYTSSHYVMRYVIDCMLIIGDYENAEIFLNKYSKVMLSKRYVDDRRRFMQGAPDTELQESYCDDLRKRHPKEDFYIGSTQYDLLKVMVADSTNSFANQCLLASALLKNDLETFVSLILTGVCKTDVKNMPKNYQEAVLLYWAISDDIKPGTKEFNISPYLKESFNEFMKIMSSKSTNKKAIVRKRYPNSYWTYYFFDNPERTGSRIIEQ